MKRNSAINQYNSIIWSIYPTSFYLELIFETTVLCWIQKAHISRLEVTQTFHHSSYSLHFKSVQVKFHPNMMKIRLAVFAYYSNRPTETSPDIHPAASAHYWGFAQGHFREILPDHLTAQMCPLPSRTSSNFFQYLSPLAIVCVKYISSHWTISSSKARTLLTSVHLCLTHNICFWINESFSMVLKNFLIY